MNLTSLKHAQVQAGWMESEVDEEYRQIADWEALADADRRNYSGEAFELGVEHPRRFARERAAFALAEVAKSRSLP